MLTLTIKTENAAFGENGYEAEEEVARILRDAAVRIVRSGVRDFSLHDANGNTVGRVEWD